MQPTLEFRGLCAFVSERADVAASQTLDVLLVDALRAGLTCPHDGVMFLPASIEDPDNLTTNIVTHRKLQLLNDQDPHQGKKVRFVPVGLSALAFSGLQTSNVEMVPDMSRVCGIGTVASGCFSTPPTKPIAARIELPVGGDLFCHPGHATSREWSFAPKVGDCYHHVFSWVVQYRLPAADHFLLEVETLSGTSLGNLTLRSAVEPLVINNLCTIEGILTPSDDTVVYFELLDPPFAGQRPRARENASCMSPAIDSPGIGCIPFRMSRT